jgi:LysR family transcriptional regulator, nod-box dependent transcriptional activator
VRFHKLDLNLLVALDALLKHRHVTHAAEHLCLSQSAMSGCLARLRAHFKDDLIVQVGRRMVLTPLGERLAQPLHELLAQTEGLINSAPRFDPAVSDRTFVVIVSDYAAQVLMVPVLQRITREAPNVKVTIDRLSEDHVESFPRGEHELLLIAEKAAVDCCEREHIFDDEYVCVVWSGNRDVGRTITTEQYLSMPHVVAQFPYGRLSTYDEQHLQYLGFRRNVAVTTPTFTLVPLFVIGTDRIATVQSRLALQCAQYMPLKIVPSPIQFPVLREVLLWQPHLNSDPALHWFRDLLKRTAEEIEPLDRKVRTLLGSSREAAAPIGAT